MARFDAYANTRGSGYLLHVGALKNPSH
jgi:hypothetical protein